MFQTKVVEIVKTHILCPITFSENCAVYEITWKNVVKLDRSQDENIIQCMHFACQITKATIQTHVQNI